jgi:hypothetical protein
MRTKKVHLETEETVSTREWVDKRTIPRDTHVAGNKIRRPDVLTASPSVQGVIGTPLGAAVLGGRPRKNFISRLPEVLLEDSHITCRMRINIRGGRIVACCIAGIADNDTVVIIIASMRILSRAMKNIF